MLPQFQSEQSSDKREDVVAMYSLFGISNSLPVQLVPVTDSLPRLLRSKPGRHSDELGELRCAHRSSHRAHYSTSHVQRQAG